MPCLNYKIWPAWNTKPPLGVYIVSADEKHPSEPWTRVTSEQAVSVQPEGWIQAIEQQPGSQNSGLLLGYASRRRC